MHSTSSYDNSRKRRSDSEVITEQQVKSNSGTSNTMTENKMDGEPVVVVRIKMRMKRFHGVAMWSWNANDDVCGICQTAFEGTAPGVKYPGEDCPVVWGKCGHAYHLQCVSKWLSQPSSKSSCPICRQEWEFGQNPINTDDSSGDSR